MSNTQKISASSNKRLAKNTLVLYFRTIVVMVISLFTSRVILKSLGVEDYGTYNVIGGFVAMFSLLGGTLVGATQRFINIELGKKDGGNPNKVFCTAMGIHAGLSLIILIALETFGLWFLNYKMNIPDGRMFAANVVFQCSILAFLLNIICMPYNAIIIAFERMKAFAYITMFDAVVKLIISYLLFLIASDRLIWYAFLLLGLAISERSVYSIYCKRHFPEVSEFHLVKEKQAYVNQISFAGYTFLGSFAAILSNHGVNVVLNLFGGVAINAARALSMQVLYAVSKFVSDFTVSLNPQITKTYAAGDLDESMSLVYKGAKFSYYLMLLFSLPIIMLTPEILNLWLGEYPEYTVAFIRLTLVYGIITSLSKTLTTEILATGEIKANALIIGGLRIFILPLSFLVLWLGYNPCSVYYVMIVIDTISIFTRLVVLRNITGVRIINYVKNVLFYIIPVSILAVLLNFSLKFVMPDSMIYNIIYVICSLLISSAIIFYVGLSFSERDMLTKGIKKIIGKIK